VTGEPAGDFLKTSTGYLHKEHIQTLSQASRHADWVSAAESLIGRPYIWGGISSLGLDCSGLVQTALRLCGLDAPRDSDQQAGMGESMSLSGLDKLRRGDLIFWIGHVGIMTSQTRLLHANAHHMMVAAEPLSTARDRIRESAGPMTAIRRLKI